MNKQKQAITIQAVTRTKVIKLLGITEQQYGEYVMAYGLAYLQKHLGGNMMAKSLSETAMYWGWWRNHWHAIDLEFASVARQFSETERGELYDRLHSLEGFGFTPPRPVMQDAFKQITYQPAIVHHL